MGILVYCGCFIWSCWSYITVWNVMCMHALQASSLAEVCWGMWCLVRACRQFEQDMVRGEFIWLCSNLKKTCCDWLSVHVFGLGPMFKILKLCVICVLFLRQLVNERWVFLVTVVVSFEPCSKSWSCAWYVFCFIGSWWMKDEYFWLVWLFHLKLLKLFYENMKLFEHSCLPGYFSWRGVLAYVVSREGLQTT